MESRVVAVGSDFKNPQNILSQLRLYTSRIVISGPAHEDILSRADYYVIPLAYGSLELLDAIFEAKRLFAKIPSRGIVFIWRSKPMADLEKYAARLNVRLVSSYCCNADDAEVQAREFLANGYRIFLGHHLICDIVNRLGGRSICYYTEENYLQVVDRALLEIQRLMRFAASVGPFLPPAQTAGRSSCRYSFSDIAGTSQVMRETVNLARVFSQSNSPVLITGETGTGKELFAQSIHANSHRHGHPFLGINCGSFSESLLESELFGYDSGAFTGAARNGKAGLFELASGGSLFLDEIGEAPQSMQVKLLRVLQEGQIRRIGGGYAIPVDVRIIAATNQNIEQLVRRGLFRRDLYYRLNVLRLHLPGLRDRREDLYDLVQVIVKKYHLESGTALITREILEQFGNYHWPGNVRELENLVQRKSILQKCMTEKVPGGYPDYFTVHDARIDDSPLAGAPDNMAVEQISPAGYLAHKKLEEALYFQSVVNQFGGNKTKAAAFLGISRTTLWSKLNTLKEKRKGSAGNLCRVPGGFIEKPPEKIAHVF
jgi:DNA-binding NtrC family response regulator